MVSTLRAIVSTKWEKCEQRVPALFKWLWQKRIDFKQSISSIPLGKWSFET